MNDFYKQPKLFQWIEAILLLLTGLLPALLIIEKGGTQPFVLLTIPDLCTHCTICGNPIFYTCKYLQILFANVTWLYGK